MTRVKICGLTTADDRDAAVDAGADALGFVVDVPVDTPREIGPERAAALVDGVPPFVATVVVTIPDTAGEAIDLLDRTGADAIQVHGDLPASDLEAVAEVGARTIKAVDAADPEAARRYDGVADAVLVDSAREAGAGGTGRTHDWEAAAELRASLSTPLILAGGLAPDNVAEAVRVAEPYAVDVASGVERTGGRKDHDAVRAFVRNATRAAEAVRR